MFFMNGVSASYIPPVNPTGFQTSLWDSSSWGWASSSWGWVSGLGSCNMWLKLHPTGEYFWAHDISIIFCVPCKRQRSQSDHFSSVPTELHVDFSLQPWLLKSISATLYFVSSKSCSTYRCTFWCIHGGKWDQCPPTSTLLSQVCTYFAPTAISTLATNLWFSIPVS